MLKKLANQGSLIYELNSRKAACRVDPRFNANGLITDLY